MTRYTNQTTTYLLILLIISNLCSCKSKNNAKDLDLKNFEHIEVPYNRSVHRITLKLSGKWTISVPPLNKDWLHVYPEKGRGHSILYITTEVNDVFNKRSCELILENEENNYRIIVDQKSAPKVKELCEYELPIIFHILHNASVPQDHINSKLLSNIIEKVNIKYSKRDNVNNSLDIGVRFKLAESDERGQPLSSPGIHKVEWSTLPEKPENIIGVKNNKKLFNQLWDFDKYINIFLFPFENNEKKNSTTLGIANLPFLSKAHEIKGLGSVGRNSNIAYVHCIVINSKYIESIGDELHFGVNKPLHFFSTDIVNTIAHELGHYLGLFHVFSEHREKENSSNIASACIDSDYCDDTPTYNRKYYNEWLINSIESLNGRQIDPSVNPNDLELFKSWFQRESCIDENKSYQAQNIMDYSFCLNYNFSENQKRRMRHVLNYAYWIPGPKYFDSESIRTQLGSEKISKGYINLCPTTPDILK